MRSTTEVMEVASYTNKPEKSALYCMLYSRYLESVQLQIAPSEPEPDVPALDVLYRDYSAYRPTPDGYPKESIAAAPQA